MNNPADLRTLRFAVLLDAMHDCPHIRSSGENRLQLRATRNALFSIVPLALNTSREHNSDALGQYCRAGVNGAFRTPLLQGESIAFQTMTSVALG